MTTLGAEGSASRPGRSLPPRKGTVPIVQEDGWAPGPVCTGAENFVPSPPGFDPRTVQPVASRYTDYSTGPIYRQATPRKTEILGVLQHLPIHFI